MKIIISYPPLDKQKGYPTLGQNRQFQYFKEPTFIYPVVPASAATLLKQAGHEVIWNDSVSQGLTYPQFLDFIRRQNPDLIAFETKTPVVKQHWKIINEIRGRASGSLVGTGSLGIRGQSPKGPVPTTGGACPVTVLFGDHVTALPEESLQNSQVDFVLTGGDYDFLLLNLCKYLEKLQAFPRLRSGQAGFRLQASELEPGIYYREDGQVRNTGKFKLNHDLNSLPPIDRDLTHWQFYAYKNGNFKRTPGTYIMSGRDCWWGKCTFCSWPQMYPEFRVRNVANVLDEIALLIERYKFREIMDDTGCFPQGPWLRDFCKGVISRGFNKKVYLDCNMRFGALDYDDFSLMKKANFRLLLFGLESANQNTLDRINKNLKVERIIQDCVSATKAGLFPHITIMFGYPWEDYEGALKTLKLGRWLLNKGYAYTMQATIVIPYPGTLLFEDCYRQGLLRTTDWDGYDMKAPVMQTNIPDDLIADLVQDMYKVSFKPEFLFKKIFAMRDIDDLKYALRAAKKVAGHIFDFKQRFH